MAFERVKKVRKMMAERSLDVALFSPSNDLFYLTGIRDRLLERLSCVVITKDDVIFIAPGFEIGNTPADIRAQITCKGWTDGEDPFAILGHYLPEGEKRATICGIAPSWILLGAQKLRPGYVWENADSILQEMRIHKDQKEHDILKDVQKRSNKALTRLLSHGLCGMTELEAAKLLVQYSEEEGLDGEMPIVAAGHNSALPHHHCSHYTIARGDVLVIDFGGVDHDTGYQSDTTRTYAVKEIPIDLPEIYNIVMAANQAAFVAAKPGATCESVDAAARKVITDAGYGEYFTHRLGHGLGLDIHEEPYLTTGNKRIVEAGNVFSDEPGIYIPNKFGVRIEDLLYIHPNGAERLTPLGHDLWVID